LLPQKRGHRFTLKKDNKPKINPKHPAHYTLSWIACVDDYYNLHYTPKAKHSKYPKKMNWNDNKKKFQNTQKMHGWHPTKVQYPGQLTIAPKKFMTKECLNRWHWWEYTENHCPWHVQKKINRKYWLKVNQLGKGKAHRTKKSQ